MIYIKLIKELIDTNQKDDLLNSLSSLFIKHHFRPDKKLGQNFLISNKAIGMILEEVPKGKVVLEVGPGTGVLTQGLLQKSKKVFAIEKDSNLAEILLQEFGKSLVLENKDVLDCDLAKFIKKNKIEILVSAVPYNISTNFLLSILPLKIKKSILIFQQNFVEKIAFGEYSNNYISCMVNYFTNPEFLYVFGPDVFYPAPKINSQLMILKYKSKLPFDKKQEEQFMKIMFEVFRFSNKKLSKSLTYALKNITNKDILKTIDSLINLNSKFLDMKVHEITTKEYVSIFKKVF